MYINIAPYFRVMLDDFKDGINTNAILKAQSLKYRGKTAIVALEMDGRQGGFLCDLWNYDIRRPKIVTVKELGNNFIYTCGWKIAFPTD